ncbi:MAG TPA: potassium-transporting ATPase subunit KdpA [Candidatus Saccharimonadales bacterium]|nr:potassium-transporting ATPase subunit KdpA [Candidatus Saccharimonadales bacterium]
MNSHTVLQYAAFLALVTVLVKPLGAYMARVFERQRTVLDPVMSPVERLLYRITGVDPLDEMDWKRYAYCFALLGFTGTVALYAILRVQQFLPGFDAAHMSTPMTPDLAMNTAISFSTTTTWQAYGGETTMSYFSQLVGLTVQNFLAGASGLSVGVAFVRGFARQQATKLGNFWVDLVRSLLWILLPLSVVGALLLVSQGVIMNFRPYTAAAPVDSSEVKTIGDQSSTNPAPTMQTIAQGPVAALEIIKNLGTNGGGFFNVNGAHPFENPTPLSNFLEMLAIMLLPAAFTYTFGRMVKDTRQGWTLYVVMSLLFMAALLICGAAEQQVNPDISRAGVDSQINGNMEGKEVRFGVSQSVLTAVVTSNGATGSYNSMHDSYTPLGGTVPLVNMLLGEIVFGGLGTGLYSIIMLALIGLMLSGLMVGRTPEYLGKKIRPSEAKMITIYALATPIAILPLTAIAVVSKAGLAGLTTNNGAHGFTEILFAFASSMANNGQNFAGLSANSVFYNVSTSAAMMIGRFALAIPALCFAGLYAKQIRQPVTVGAVRTDSITFSVVLISTALIVMGLSFFPALTLGPILEHLLGFR